jgi:PKD repeat protein
VATDRAANTPPTCAALDVTTPRDAAVQVQLDCSDADGDTLTLEVVDTPSPGTLGSIDGSNRVWYTPEAGFIGADLFAYKAYDGQAYSDAATVTVTVANRPPTADFVFSPTNPDAGEEVTFTSTSIDPDGDVDTLEWDLDDDGQYDDGAGSQVAKTFTDGGSHTVGLKATDTNGAPDTVEHDVFVTPNPAPVCAPVDAEVPRTQLLEIALPCTDDDALTLEILNGGPAHGGVESIDPGNLRVSYRAPSQYLGPDGFTYRVSDGVTTTEATVSLTVVNHPPAGDFIFDPVAPEAKQTITFFAAAQDPDGSITGYAWDLDGDGEFDDGTSEEASHVFSWGGTYTVKLRVTDDSGRSATIDHAITVAGDPPPSSTPTPTPTPGAGTGSGAGGAAGSGTGSPPGAGGPRAADRTAPTVSARIARQPLDTVRSKGLAMTLVASEACSVKVSLELDKATARRLKLERRPKGNVVVGTAQQTLVGPQATARVKLTAKARKALRRVRSVKLRIALSATDSAGNTASIAVKLLTIRE